MDKRPAVASRASMLRIVNLISDTGECGGTFPASRVFLAYRFSKTSDNYDEQHQSPAAVLAFFATLSRV